MINTHNIHEDKIWTDTVTQEEKRNGPKIRTILPRLYFTCDFKLSVLVMYLMLVGNRLQSVSL